MSGDFARGTADDDAGAQKHLSPDQFAAVEGDKDPGHDVRPDLVSSELDGGLGSYGEPDAIGGGYGGYSGYAGWGI